MLIINILTGIENGIDMVLKGTYPCWVVPVDDSGYLKKFFAAFIIFRLMGKTYDAAVITAGFTGLGLGATPVAIANMNAITGKYGPSFKAFLVVPLVGAFFIDLLNAVIIKFFLGLEVMQSTPLPGT